MPFFDGFELLKTAIDEETESKYFIRWVVGYQSTTTYEEFKNKLRQSSMSDTRSSDEILESVEAMMKLFGEK